MSQPQHGDTPPPGVGRRPLEIAMAVLMLLLGALVIVDSLRLGMRWADDGPQAGYFPFYVGLLLVLASGVSLVRGIVGGASTGKRGEVFVTREQLVSMAKLLLPFAVYVGAIKLLGIYVASLVFIAYCMRALGRYGWGMLVGVSVVVTALLFVLFEVWFKMPLIKGPLEAALGLG